MSATTVRLLLLAVLLVVALLLFLLVDRGERAVEPTPSVRTAQEWPGRWQLEPPPVVPAPVAARARTAPIRATSAGALVHGHACGGDLPPCYVMLRESGGNPTAYNPTGCGGRGCRGKWQCDPRTCSGTGTEAQQDDEARALWDHGRGCAHWNACV